MKPKVVFHPVKDAQAKIRIICQSIQSLVSKGKKVLIAVSNDEAAQYIDALLWRYPEDSFLPHTISQKKSAERVVITTLANENLNDAACLFNLRSDISPLVDSYEEIHELYDETHPAKMEISKKKVVEYQSKGMLI